MGVSTNGQRVSSEHRNGAPRCAGITEESLRRIYEQSVRQLLDALEARLLEWPPEQKLRAIGAMAAAVEEGKQVTISVRPLTVRF